jgi:DNA-binding LacI/PurR family transcriptional regulator
MKQDLKPPTVTDVARSAGVAVGTVSRVLNGAPNVDGAIRDRVLAAARSLGYDRLRKPKRRQPPPAPARFGAATNVAVICFGMEDTLVQLPVVSRAVHGIERAAAAEGASLMLANIPDGSRIPSFLSRQKVLGVILKGPNQGLLPPPKSNPLLDALTHVPKVWLLGRPPNAVGDHCNFDPWHAGRLVADHLLAYGHRRIAFLNPKPGQVQFAALEQGLALALLAHGLPLQRLESVPTASLAWPLPATTSADNVTALVRTWHDTPAADRATALFVPSDKTSSQVYAALERFGLRVGRDVSVISCNNEESIATSLQPTLTSVDIHGDAVGQRAVAQLYWRSRNPQSSPNAQILVEPSLVIRASVQRIQPD